MPRGASAPQGIVKYKDLPGRHHCPVMLPYFAFARSGDRLSTLRRRVYSAQLHDNARRQRRVPVYGLIWPFKSLSKAWQASSTWGRAAHQLGAPSPWRQLLQLWWVSVRHNMTFDGYYSYRLWRREAYAQISGYLEDFEVIWFSHAWLGEQDVAPVDDKASFAELCREHGLPTIPVVAEFSQRGEVTWHEPYSAFPRADLFVKSNGLWSGAGAAVWAWDASCELWCGRGERLGPEALLERLRADARSGSLVVQPRVRNHSSIVDCSPNAVCTLRCLTWRCRGSSADVLLNIWRIPRAGMITDHATSGAFSAAVEPDGRLRRPRSRLLAEPGDDHPDFGSRITGRVLPCFEEMLALCRKAHDVSGLDGLFGWDVALLESGPTLVEGNSVSGLGGLQAAFDMPIGTTRFVEIAERLLNRPYGSAAEA